MLSGTNRFLKQSSAVKGVTFSPKHRYLFASGGNDGTINIYNAHNTSFHSLLVSYQLTPARSITGIKFTCDGRTILTVVASRRVTVLDVERGEQIICYENCAYNGKERVPLATDPLCPHLAICSCVKGKGLTLFDLRMPIPYDCIFDLHSNIIKDLTFLNNSWPFMEGDQPGLVSLSCDGICKITTCRGHPLYCFEVGHRSNCVTSTPEKFGSSVSHGFNSHLIIGGEFLSSFTPSDNLQKRHEPLNNVNAANFSRLKFNSTGSLLYAACEGNKVIRFRRYPNEYTYIDDVITHKSDLNDFDISPYDEFLVTASKDKTVGIMNLGLPNHGYTGYFELT